MRSGYEYQVRDWLDANNIDYEYETETLSYESPVRGARCSECGAKVTKPRKYTPDFVIFRPEPFDPRAWNKLYVECKGRFPSTDRSKMRDVKKCHPDLDIRMLFQRRSKKDTESIAKWCEKFGFKYHFGVDIPTDWL